MPFNMDAREFVRMLVDRQNTSDLKNKVPKEWLRFDHCFMNLPVDAVEFLDAFIGLFNRCDPEIWTVDNEIKLPLIHVYGFTYEATHEKALEFFTKRIGEAMHFPAFKSQDILSFHNIRDVSSKSHMYSTTFKLPKEVAFAHSDIYNFEK